MDNTQIWLDFMDLANSILINGQKINKYASNVQLIVEPSFDNHVLLQLTWDNNDVQWYRTTWQKLIDTKKINDPIVNLKYIGKQIQPTISYENGTTDLKQIQGIIDQIKQILIKPQIDKWGGIVLDGCYYTLIIGVESTQVTYKWHDLPDKWDDLQKIVGLMVEFNEKCTCS